MLIIADSIAADSNRTAQTNQPRKTQFQTLHTHSALIRCTQRSCEIIRTPFPRQQLLQRTLCHRRHMVQKELRLSAPSSSTLARARQPGLQPRRSTALDTGAFLLLKHSAGSCPAQLHGVSAARKRSSGTPASVRRASSQRRRAGGGWCSHLSASRSDTCGKVADGI